MGDNYESWISTYPLRTMRKWWTTAGTKMNSSSAKEATSKKVTPMRTMRLIARTVCGESASAGQAAMMASCVSSAYQSVGSQPFLTA